MGCEYSDGKRRGECDDDIVFQLTQEEIDELKQDKSLFISELLFWKDTYFIGECFCYGNYEMAYRLYNCNRDKCYTLITSDLDAIERGERVVLHSQHPDDDDREWVMSDA